jgi:hypothetical protein
VKKLAKRGRKWLIRGIRLSYVASKYQGFMDCPDIIAVFKKMSGEVMPNDSI